MSDNPHDADAAQSAESAWTCPNSPEYLHRDPLGQMIRMRAEASAWLAVPRGSKSWKTRGRARPFLASWPADDSRGDVFVSLPPLIASVVQFLRTGYPEGVPEHDYLPLFALLARKLTSEEVVEVADELAAHGDPTSANAIRQAIADLIHEQPLEADIARVSARLVAAGWQQPAPEHTDNHS